MWPGQCSGKICPVAEVKVLEPSKGLGTWWQDSVGFRACGGGGWGAEALTAAEQGLVHEPDVGEALLTRLRDAHLVAGEHVPIVLLDLGAEEEGAEWRGRTPLPHPHRPVGLPSMDVA